VALIVSAPETINGTQAAVKSRTTSLTDPFMRADYLCQTSVQAISHSPLQLCNRRATPVAQICNLPYRRIVFGRASALSMRFELVTRGGLQIRDTAECHSALRGVRQAEPVPFTTSIPAIAGRLLRHWRGKLL
jgi:hypothetical protein